MNVAAASRRGGQQGAVTDSARGVAAVDVEDLPVQKSEAGGEQEEQRADEVVRLAEAAERDPASASPRARPSPVPRPRTSRR